MTVYQGPDFNFGFNKFHQIETGNLILCKPDKTQLYSLGLASNIKNTIRYNALSELTFDYPKSIVGGVTDNPAYALIKGKKLVFVEQIGYYIINSCPEDNSGSVPIKHVNCLSLEAELLAPRLTGFTGTYAFATLLQLVLDLKPSWTIGNIDSSLLLLYRTFTANNTTAYSFLVNDMEKAFGCVFKFDTFHKTVFAVSNIIPVAQTNIYLSFDNLIKSIQFQEITEEICTGLYCYGGENLDIRNVNPLGGTVIYDFSYFKTTEWMSQGLIDALDDWEDRVDEQQLIYADYLTIIETINIELITLWSDLDTLNSGLISMFETRGAILSEEPPGDTGEIEEQIADQLSLIAEKMETEIKVQETYINNTRISLRKLVHHLFFTSKISFDNFKEHVSNMLDIMNTIATVHITYINTIGYPEISDETIEFIIGELVSKVNSASLILEKLYTYLSDGLSNYPPSTLELAAINDYIIDEITALNDLFDFLEICVLIEGFSIIESTVSFKYLWEQIGITRGAMQAYDEIIYFTENMTNGQYLELIAYIYENTYVNKNIIMTDIMTPVEVQAQSQILYNQSITVLGKVSQPRYEFSGDFSNFIALENFSSFTDELDLGKVIYIQKDDAILIEAVLLEVVISYDNPTDFSMTFGNSYRLDNSRFIYGDVLGAAAQVGSNIS